MIAKSFTKAIKGITFITIGALSFFTLPATAQQPLMTNDGAMVYVNLGAKMIVNGHFHNKDSILINLADTFNVRGNFTNDATFGGTGFLPASNGLTIVGGNWYNNSTFRSGTGKVLLDSGLQLISGGVSSHFNDLELAGTARKEIQGVDQYVGSLHQGTLILNDIELWTDQYTMFVENNNQAAITRTTGFVSSLVSGSLSREMQNVAPYEFPVGSTQGTQRLYRPVFITTAASNPNRFTVRLVNADPATDDPNDNTDYSKPATSHDTTICYVNDNYWYKINHPDGTDHAHVALSYDETEPADQGAYNGIVQWDTVAGQWTSIGTTESVTGSPIVVVQKNAHWNFSPEPFTLAYQVPPPPPISGVDVLCADVVTTYSIIPNTNGTYVFTIDTAQGVIVSTTATSVDVIWNDVDSGWVTVIETIDNQNGYVACPSLVGSFPVNILSLPHAIFETVYEYPNPNPNGTYNYNNPDDVFINDLISFHDSSTNTVSWYWDFQDMGTSIVQNPYHTYGDLGSYNVMMVATSPDGCLDTTYKTINVVEGIIVSNVFTPDGDGYNDVFKIRSSNVSEFTFRVFNRWGTEIFSTTAPEIAWDGTTSAGSEAPAGTYFYTLKAKLNSGNDITIYQDKNTLDKGCITLIR